ncbi:MAG: hypothetical protein ACYDHN_13555, partial [Solirubrobacteraceae bacterium]
MSEPLPLQAVQKDVSIKLTVPQLERISRRSPVLRFWLADIRAALTKRAQATYDVRSLDKALIRGLVVLATLPVTRAYVDGVGLARQVGYTPS